MFRNVRTVCTIVLCLISFFVVVSVAESNCKSVKKSVKKTKKAVNNSKTKVSAKKQQREVQIVKAHRKPVDRIPTVEFTEEMLTAELVDDAAPFDGVAYRLIGAKYHFGGNDISGIDCSSFVQRVYSLLKISIPRTAREQFRVGKEVSSKEIQKGDLLFFHTYANFPSHVGIYLGDNRMIHASSGSHRVTISSMDTPYYRSRFLGARRLEGEGIAPPLLLAGL